MEFLCVKGLLPGAATAPHSTVTMRLYAHEIEIRDATGGVLRRHEKAPRKGQFVLADTRHGRCNMLVGTEKQAAWPLVIPRDVAWTMKELVDARHPDFASLIRATSPTIDAPLKR